MSLTKPDLTNEEISSCLQYEYGLKIESLSFLPIGADFNTSVYRVTTTDGAAYFLKLRRGEFLEASVRVPKYLADLGVKHVIPPLVTKTGHLWASVASFKAVLYPYVDGCQGVEVNLSEDHWVQFGTVLKKLHSADIPSAITNGLPQEAFSSKARETVKDFLARIENEVFEEPIASKMATFLKSKSAEILKIIDQAEVLALRLQKCPLEHVLCHGDIHGWNLMVDKGDALYIVDWDTLIFAPKERDLMFMGAGIWESSRTPDEDETLFYRGYGQTEINQDAICYYRFERIIQDIGEYCEHILLSDKAGDDRMQSFQCLKSNWRAGGTIERAYESMGE